MNSSMRHTPTRSRWGVATWYTPGMGQEPTLGGTCACQGFALKDCSCANPKTRQLMPIPKVRSIYLKPTS